MEAVVAFVPDDRMSASCQVSIHYVPAPARRVASQGQFTLQDSATVLHLPVSDLQGVLVQVGDLGAAAQTQPPLCGLPMSWLAILPAMTSCCTGQERSGLTSQSSSPREQLTVQAGVLTSTPPIDTDTRAFLWSNVQGVPCDEAVVELQSFEIISWLSQNNLL